MKTHKVRPVLVESKKSELHLSHDKLLITSIKPTEKSDLYKSIPQEFILISLEDEKIEVGDICAALKVNSLGDIDKVCKIKKILNERSHNYLAEDGWRYSDSYLQKVIARQSQISPEYISKFIEQYNNGSVEDIEIKMEENIVITQREPLIQHQGNKPVVVPHVIKNKPKLTNNFVTIVEKEFVLEEGIIIAAKRYAGFDIRIDPNDFDERYFRNQDCEKYDAFLAGIKWFNENKKK